MTASLLVALSLLTPITASPIRHTADEVLLVCNVSSPVSCAIGDDYARLRHVRSRVSIQCPDSSTKTENESISLKDFRSEIEPPIRRYLASHPHIQFIVLTKGIPIRITEAPVGSCDEHSKVPVAVRGNPSVDSFLAALDYESRPGLRRLTIAGSGAIGIAYANRYWNSREPFSHAKFGGYLVTRLDGYSESDAKSLVRQAIYAENHLPQILRQGTVLLDAQPAFGMGDRAKQPEPIIGDDIPTESDYSGFNADLVNAHDILAKRKIADELDVSETFIGKRSSLLAYFSWGSNDAKYSADAYQSLRFAPGSICDTAVSTSARTFLPTRGGQSLLADLVAHGLTCGKGYCDEPLLQAVASPSITMERYTAGFTMAESLYAASHFVAWEDIVIGDPLCCPYFRLAK